MHPDILTRLLRGEHISMPERIALGSWPHEPLRYRDLVEHLALILKNERWFPRPWEPPKQGEPVNEHAVIERQSSVRFVYRCARHHPIDPYQLAEQTEHVFWSARAAAKYYLRWELALPGDLDGWKVVE